MWYSLRQISLMVLTFVLLSSGSVQAQVASSCDALTKGGIYDRFSVLNRSSQLDMAKQWMCGAQLASSDEALKLGLQLKFPIKNLPLALGFNMEKEDWKGWYEHFCNSTKGYHSENSDFELVVEQINKGLVEVMQKCIDANLTGLRYWFETSKNRDFVVLSVRFYSSGDDQTKILTPLSLHPYLDVAKVCDKTQLPLFLPKKEIGRAGISISCTVPAGQLANFTMATRAGIVQKLFDGYLNPSDVAPAVPSQRATSEFTASASTIVRGQAVTLSWNLKNASLVKLIGVTENEIGVPPSGKYTFKPTTTATYTIVAFNKARNGQMLNIPYNVSVTVNPRIRVFEDINFGPSSMDIDESNSLKGKALMHRVSSMKIYSNEQVMFLGFSNKQSSASNIIDGLKEAAAKLIPHMLIVEGPGEIPNLHKISMEGADGENWGDAIAEVVIIEGPLPTILSPQKLKLAQLTR